jgi:hypothetical protein
MRVRSDIIAGQVKADREQRCMDALSGYLDDLQRSGNSLPLCYGVVSRSQVARACGFTK